MLHDKNAVIHGGGGSIGGAIARAFARDGARVFLAGRTAATLDATAAAIRAGGGRADTAVVDALDADAVAAHADAVVAAGGSLDVSVCVIDIRDVQGTPVIDMDIDDYLQPVVTALRAQLVTAQAAARHMARQDGGGVLLFFGGEGDPPRGWSLGGLQTAFHAVEALRRQLAVELGAQGIRTITVRTGGVPETIPATDERRSAIEESLRASTLTGRAATLDDVGAAFAFAASDRARAMTGATLNVSAGALLD